MTMLSLKNSWKKIVIGEEQLEMNMRISWINISWKQDRETIKKII